MALVQICWNFEHNQKEMVDRATVFWGQTEGMLELDVRRLKSISSTDYFYAMDGHILVFCSLLIAFHFLFLRSMEQEIQVATKQQ